MNDEYIQKWIIKAKNDFKIAKHEQGDHQFLCQPLLISCIAFWFMP